MPENARATVAVVVDGELRRAAAGSTVAGALLAAGIWRFRRAVGGAARGPLCGMGVCHECRVTIDGVRHQRACLVPVAEGMTVRTIDDSAV